MACAAGAPEPAAGPGPPAATAPPKAGNDPALPALTNVAETWPGQGRCHDVLAELAVMAPSRRQLLLPEASPVALAVVDRGTTLPRSAAATGLVLDLPIPLTDDLLGGAPCLVMLDRTASARAGQRRVLAHELVRSSYRRGTRHLPNAERTALERAARQAERDRGPEIMATGDPGIDLLGLVAGGIIGGIDLFRRAGESERLRQQIAATPDSIEEPVWEPYTYDVTTIEAARTGPLRAALVDHGLGRSWTLDLTVRETRTFRVASNRNPKDRDLLDGHDGTLAVAADVTVWEEGGLRPAASDLVQRLADATDERPTPATAIASAWAGNPRQAQAAIEPAAGPGGKAERASGCRRTGSTGLVEQIVDADGTRRYRLAGSGGSHCAEQADADELTGAP